MKKTLIVIMFMFLIIPVFAQENIKESIITTDMVINREIMPDTAKIRFSVQNSGINLESLKQKNDEIVNNAIKAIKLQLNQNETIKTISFNVRNVYSYKDKIRVFQKYEVSNGFEVKLKDLNKVSKIINLAMDNGVKNVNGINFLIEESENVCNSMMIDAVKMGKNRVQLLANAAGITLDKVKSINPYCSLTSSNTQPRYNKMVFNSADVDSASNESMLETIEAGSINVRASVNMVYYLK